MATAEEQARQPEIITKEQLCQLLQHAMQTGVLCTLQRQLTNHISDFADINSELIRELKHLRVGINSALIETGALTKCLVDAGVITLADFMDARIELLQRDVQSYERELGIKLA